MEDSERLEQFQAFYEATKSPVFRAVLLARAGDRHAAEDAVAEGLRERLYPPQSRVAGHSSQDERARCTTGTSSKHLTKDRHRMAIGARGISGGSREPAKPARASRSAALPEPP